MSMASGKPSTEASVPPVVDRITVALIPRAAGDLQHLQEQTSLSKTDLVNRAISLYEFVNDQLCAGRELLVRDNGTTQVLRLL